ncbi:response regulator [Streptomyces sp. NPDC002564]|uniref:response regulator n=1 Tax=Streptomyces sp. NPDC002564 TaxID=3364649 RepID=UPI003697A0BE
MPPVNVMVVDDDKLLRYGLRRILESAGSITVSAVCDGADAVERAVRHRPDVVLVDLHMPDLDGISVLRALRGLDAPPVVAVLTGFGDDAQVTEAFAAGAAGFFLKDAAARELIPGVLLLAAGGSALSARVVRSLRAAPAPPLAGPAEPPLPPAATPPAVPAVPAVPPVAPTVALTGRERDVLDLLATGMTNAQIAERLLLSRSTVKDHVSSVLAKLGASNRIQAAVLARATVR